MSREHDTLSRATAAGTLTLDEGVTVARMGFGAMRLTGPGIFGPPANREECRRVLRRAIELGVTFFDTADSYGPAISEQIIAEALYPYPSGTVIATKGGFVRPGPDRWETDGRPEHLRAACESSLRRLRLDRIDLYQLHRIDPKVPEADQFGALSDLRDEGKIRFVGLSEVDVDAIERARQSLPVISVQNRYNVLDRTSDGVVEYCERHDLVFIPWHPLGAGTLDISGALGAVARRHGATALQVGLAWLLARSRIMLPIPGTSSTNHLEENVAAASIALSVDDLRALNSLQPSSQSS
ncbi:MAG TPA: aldo/keto reductase [Vicinamibacterales bacterium]|jgi:aryl-alcohol dehydrogenase-like predicted oxidoreductase